MKWLPKDKRNPFILVVVITVAVLALIYFFILQAQNSAISRIRQARKTSATELQNMEKSIQNVEATTNELANVTAALARAEADMATGDQYSWAYGTLRQFKQNYKVELPDIGHPTEGDVDLIPAFPYRQMRFSVGGKGYYHDIGKFVSDLENNFPHLRVVNLSIDSGSDGEKLSFRMDLVALIKPNAS